MERIVRMTKTLIQEGRSLPRKTNPRARCALAAASGGPGKTCLARAAAAYAGSWCAATRAGCCSRTTRSGWIHVIAVRAACRTTVVNKRGQPALISSAVCHACSFTGNNSVLAAPVTRSTLTTQKPAIDLLLSQPAAHGHPIHLQQFSDGRFIDFLGVCRIRRRPRSFLCLCQVLLRPGKPVTGPFQVVERVHGVDRTTRNVSGE